MSPLIISDIRDVAVTVTAVVAALSAIFGFVGWLVIPRLKSWIHKEIAKPVQASLHQLTVNQHSSKDPTILDRFDDLESKINHLHAEVRDQVEALEESDRHSSRALDAIAMVMDEHLRWSREWTSTHGSPHNH